MEFLLLQGVEQQAPQEQLSVEDSSKLDQLLLESELLINQSSNSPINLIISSGDQKPENEASISETSRQVSMACRSLNNVTSMESPDTFFTQSFMPEEIEK